MYQNEVIAQFEPSAEKNTDKYIINKNGSNSRSPRLIYLGLLFNRRLRKNIKKIADINKVSGVTRNANCSNAAQGEMSPMRPRNITISLVLGGRLICRTKSFWRSLLAVYVCKETSSSYSFRNRRLAARVITGRTTNA